MEIPERRSWYFPGQGWLGLALQDEEREEGRGEHPLFCVGSTELPVLTSIGWLVGVLIELFSGSVSPGSGCPMEHSISQEDADLQVLLSQLCCSWMSSDTIPGWKLKDVAKEQRDLEFPFSPYMPEGPLQGSLSLEKRIARTVEKINMKIFE